MKGARAIALGLVVLALASCSAIYRNHGYTPVETELAEIAVGVDTRDTVAAKVGRPSAEGLLQEGAWYYVSSRYRHFGLRKPQEIDRQVLVISFDTGGTVENIERFGLEKGQIVPLSRRVTESNVKGMSVIGQILGNFGRINPGQLLQ